MSKVYLSQVRISNFRTYGPDFQLDLPPGPGIVVLNGMNGLGKTAFFEAIEWALTGTVQRLKERLRQNMRLDRRLTREAAGVEVGAHAVELIFSEGTVLRRNATESPAPARLDKLLRQPDWKPAIHDIGTYLRLTHFLPQSSRERYLERDDDEQWQLLKGPTGVERLEKFRSLLNDRKAIAAFNARIENLEFLRDNARRALDDWNSRLQQRETLRAGVLASGACSPERATEIVEQIRQQMAALGDAPAAFGGVEAAQQLVALRRALEAGRARVAEALQNAAAAEATLDEWERLTARRAAAQDRQRVIEAVLPDQAAAAGAAVTLSNDKRGRLTAAEGALREATRRAESLRLVLDALRALAEEITPALLAAREGLAEIDRRDTALAERTRRHADERTARDGLERQIRETRQAQAAMEPSATRLAAALEARDAADRALAARDGVSEGARLVRESEANAVQAVTAATEEAARVQARFEAAQAAADVIAQAVAEIARHLHEQDTRCPVCEHRYPPGELRARALAAVTRLAPDFGDLTGKLDLARRALAAAKETLADARRQSGLATDQLAAITRAQEEAAARKSAVENDPVFPALELGALTAWLETRRAELAGRAAQLSAQLAVRPPAAELDREAGELRAAREQLGRERAQATAALASLENRRDGCEATLGARLPALAPLGRDDAAELAAARAEALRQADAHRAFAGELRAELGLLETAARTAQENLQTSRHAQQMAADELQRAEQSAAGFLAAWRRRGLGGEPGRETLARRLSECSELRDRYDGLLERQRATAEELLAWQRHEQLRRLEEEMRAAVERGGGTEEAPHRDRLEKLFRDADGAVDRARAASRQAAEVSRQLQASAEAFSAEALAPLSRQISAFSRIVSPFGYRFQVRARHAATQVRAELAIAEPGQAAGQRPAREHEPATWLSEGQASALGLCVLLGASTAYRWSRWPALLLDDPLQNTDLIHAAAFIDIVRGLMKDSDYQMFVSTHDGQEADFLIRRCAQFGLPVTRMDLLGLTPEGLHYKVKAE